MSEPVSVSMKEIEKVIGKFVVLYRNEQRSPVKVLKNLPEEKRFVYEVLTGPDKGKKFSSRFDESQSALVYDDDNLMLALMETGG